MQPSPRQLIVPDTLEIQPYDAWDIGVAGLPFLAGTVLLILVRVRRTRIQVRRAPGRS